MAPPSVYARRQLTGTGDGVAAQLRKQKEAGLREGGGDNPRQWGGEEEEVLRHRTLEVRFHTRTSLDSGASSSGQALS